MLWKSFYFVKSVVCSFSTSGCLCKSDVTMKKTSPGWQHAFDSRMLLCFLYFLCFCKVCRSKDSIYCAGYPEILLGKRGGEQNLLGGFVKADNQINFKIADCYLSRWQTLPPQNPQSLNELQVIKKTSVICHFLPSLSPNYITHTCLITMVEGSSRVIAQLSVGVGGP